VRGSHAAGDRCPASGLVPAASRRFFAAHADRESRLPASFREVGRRWGRGEGPNHRRRRRVWASAIRAVPPLPTTRRSAISGAPGRRTRPARVRASHRPSLARLFGFERRPEFGLRSGPSNAVHLDRDQFAVLDELAEPFPATSGCPCRQLEVISDSSERPLARIGAVSEIPGTHHKVKAAPALRIPLPLRATALVPLIDCRISKIRRLPRKYGWAAASRRRAGEGPGNEVCYRRERARGVSGWRLLVCAAVQCFFNPAGVPPPTAVRPISYRRQDDQRPYFIGGPLFGRRPLTKLPRRAAWARFFIKAHIPAIRPLVPQNMEIGAGGIQDGELSLFDRRRRRTAHRHVFPQYTDCGCRRSVTDGAQLRCPNKFSWIGVSMTTSPLTFHGSLAHQ